MTNNGCNKQLVSAENHIVLELINFELQKLVDATYGCHHYLISKYIVRLSKDVNLTYDRLIEVVQGYDDFLMKLLDDYFKRVYKDVVKEVMDNFIAIVSEFNQKMITAAIPPIA
jgi:hypothetical protein